LRPSSRMWALGFRVQGLGFRVWGLGSRVFGGAKEGEGECPAIDVSVRHNIYAGDVLKGSFHRP